MVSYRRRHIHLMHPKQRPKTKPCASFSINDSWDIFNYKLEPMIKEIFRLFKLGLLNSNSSLFSVGIWWAWRHRNLACLNNEVWSLNRLSFNIRSSAEVIKNAFSKNGVVVVYQVELLQSLVHHFQRGWELS